MNRKMRLAMAAEARKKKPNHTIRLGKVTPYQLGRQMFTGDRQLSTHRSGSHAVAEQSATKIYAMRGD